MMERTVRFELVPQSIDAAIDEIQRNMAHLAECSGNADPAACVVGVEVMDDGSAFLVVVDFGGDRPTGIPVCIRSAMPVDAIVARLTACRPDFTKRTLH